MVEPKYQIGDRVRTISQNCLIPVGTEGEIFYLFSKIRACQIKFDDRDSFVILQLCLDDIEKCPNTK